MTTVIDHRRAQAEVRDQGTRPTCVGFAVSAAHEWMAGDGTVRSAEDAMWAGHQVASVPGREETAVAWALQGLEANEHASEDAWPYGNPHFSAGRPHATLDASNRRALPRWRPLAQVTLAAVRGELDRGRAIVLSLRLVRSAWRRPDGVVDAEPGRKSAGNHAVLAVGVLDEPERVIIKNSWRRAWGDAGFGFVTKCYLETYGLRAHALEA